MVALKGNIPTRAFTRVELLCTLAALALLATLALPTLALTSQRSNVIECLNNLRRIGIGFHQFANEHDDLFPWNPGLEGVPNSAVDHFNSIQTQLGSPSVLFCPSDGSRIRSLRWPVDSSSVSYFVCLNADMNFNSSWLSGDRNLSGIPTGTSTLSETNNPGWQQTVHVQSGNILFADGSTGSYANNQMSNVVQKATALIGGQPLQLSLP